MAGNSIHRMNVPVTDFQQLSLSGPPISVAASRDGSSDTIDLWFEHYDQDGAPPYEHRMGADYGLYIFGTGHPVPWTPWTRHAYRFLGTVVTPSRLVWHAYVGPARGQAIGL